MTPTWSRGARGARGTRAAALALLLLAGLALGSCGRGGDEKKATAAEEPGAAPKAADHVELDAEASKNAGVTIGAAGPATIDVTVELPGEVKPDSAHVLVVHPRFAGIVHAMHKKLGDGVRRGETVATIQSNESLTDYAVPSGIAGRVVARGANMGQSVTPEAAIYTIVDLADVWIEFPVYPHQVGTIRRGQTVRVARQEGDTHAAEGVISYVGPLMAEDTRVSIARVVLPNRDGRWEPGLFVNASVVTDHAQAAIAVPDEAIVRTSEGSAVFVPDKTGYKLREVETGRTDGRTTEITNGLAAGERVVVHGAFVLKAELEKSEEE